jgi:hypothetical protein
VRFAHLLDLSTYSNARAIYGRAAREVLRHLTVRNENGKEESTATLFK